MSKTKIEWTDETWNPVTGCTKVSAGCKNCYAERLWPKVAGAEAKRTGQPPHKFTDVRCHPERLDAPLHWRKLRRVFVNSMSDLFHEAVPNEFLDQVFAVMALCPGHIFQILTKRPQRMRDYFGERPNSPANGLHHRIARRFSEMARNDDVQGFMLPLPNVHLGVSIENQATAEERIPLLLQTHAAIRFVSYEPALGPVNLSEYLCDHEWEHGTPGGLNWIIIGGESGPNARYSSPEWFYSIRNQCRDVGVPLFVKQLTERGRKIPFADWPTNIRVREYPVVEQIKARDG